MTTEYINTRVVSRQKLILKRSALLLGFLLYLFARYYFAPEDVQAGFRSSRSGLSRTELAVYSSLVILIGVPLMFWSRIVLRLSISVPDNKLRVTLIDRFRWAARTKEVLLSQTQIQTEHVEETNYLLLRKRPEYFTLHLINPEFGTLNVSEQDFDNIKEIVQYFDQIKEKAAKKIRLRRLNRRG